MITLRQWQEPLYQKLETMLQAHRCVLNAMPTGSGKTYLAGKYLELHPERRPAWIICPKTVIPSWRRVLAGIPESELLVVNWERLRARKQYWDQRTMTWNTKEFALPNMVIVDEVHKGCSGKDTHTGYMMAKLASMGVPLLMQSATVADNPLKLRSIGYALGLHNYSRDSFFTFCRNYGCYKGKFHKGLEFTKDGPRGKAAMRKLHTVLADRLLHIALEDIPGFPDSLLETELLDFSGTHPDTILARLRAVDERELAMNPESINALTINLFARKRAELTKVPLLVSETAEHLEEGKSVVVFLNFLDSISAFQELSSQQGLPTPVCIYGEDGDTGRAQRADERQASIDAFQTNKAVVCLATLSAGGEGISLHDERKERPRVSLINPGFSASQLVQALGRIRRDGGTPVVQRILLAANTVEEKVYGTLSKKMDNISALTDSDLRWEDESYERLPAAKRSKEPKISS